MAERLGLVSEIQPPAEGKKMYSAKVGGKKVRFYGTGYESQDPTPVLITFRDAENRGVTVRATGVEVPIQGNQFPMFRVESVEIVQGAVSVNGAAPAPTFQDSNRDRSIIAQVAYKIAGGLAASGAITVKEMASIAGFVFYGIQELAEGKATGSAEPPESQPAAWPES